MKKLPVFLLLMVCSVHADDNTENIRQACLKQAVAITQQLKSELYADMDRTEADRIIQISSHQCQEQFLAVSSLQFPGEITGEGEESQSGDWFTDYILSGESPDKEGNKRLDRMRHK